MKLTSIALAAALSLTAGATLAQPAPAPAGPQHPHMMRQHMDPAQMAERHAQRLRDVLQLKPDQEPALKAFVAAMQPPAGEMEKMRAEHDAMAKLTTPERLDRMQAMMAQHQARFAQHAEAIKRFYAQLTPTQQKAFDAMPMMGPMMGHGMMGRHGMKGRMHDHHMHGSMKGAPGTPPPPAPAH